MKVGDQVLVHEQYLGTVKAIWQCAEVTVTYLRGGISFAERVPVVKLKPRPPEINLASKSI